MSSCSDTDDGKYIYIKGSIDAQAISGEQVVREDSCSGDVLTEWFCKNGEKSLKYQKKDCKYGCEEGACVDACVDEEGIAPALADYVKLTSKGGSSRILTDTCVNDMTLREVSCKNKNSKTIDVRCKEPCVTETITVGGTDYTSAKCEPYYACIDTDQGKDLNVKGTVTTWDTNLNELTVVSDFCRDTDKLLEVGCSRRTCDTKVAFNGGKLAGGAAAGAAGGAAAGAAVGTQVVPVIGTAVGAVAGAVGLGGVFGDEECNWAFAANSSIYTRIHIKSKKCKYGCVDGACLNEPSDTDDPLLTEFQDGTSVEED